MSNLSLALVDVVSAILCFALLKFMLKPYNATGEERYLGLPLGFALLGTSYLIMGCVAFFGASEIDDILSYIQILSQAYAFAFLATSYYFSKKTTKHMRIWWYLAYPALFVGIFYVYLVAIVPPHFGLPSLQDSDQALLVFNILFLAYISVHTIRGQAKNPNAKRIWIPYAFLLLCFSQFCLLVWSVDQSGLSYIAAYFLRLIGLIIFVFVTYRSFHLSTKKDLLDEEDPA
jgi:hypothetical protein